MEGLQGAVPELGRSGVPREHAEAPPKCLRAADNAAPDVTSSRCGPWRLAFPLPTSVSKWGRGVWAVSFFSSLSASKPMM